MNTIQERFKFIWDVLLLKDEAYAQHVARTDVMKQGLLVLVLVTLIASLGSLAINVANDLQPARARRQEAEQAIEEFRRNWRSMQQYFDLPPGVEQGIIEGIELGMEIGFRIAELPTPLPKPLGGLLGSLGDYFSQPFARMARWIGYGIWVLLVAKLLGGNATLPQMLGTTALYTLPHVLDIFGFVPCLGTLLGLVALIWGIVVYVKAVAVANDFSLGRAIAATLLPALIAAALAVLGLLAIFVLALITG